MSQLHVADALPPVSCSECNRPLDPLDPMIYREVVGWTKERRRRAGGKGKQGGRNTISMARETGRYMHDGCVQRLKTTGVAGQEALL